MGLNFCMYTARVILWFNVLLIKLIAIGKDLRDVLRIVVASWYLIEVASIFIFEFS